MLLKDRSDYVQHKLSEHCEYGCYTNENKKMYKASLTYLLQLQEKVAIFYPYKIFPGQKNMYILHFAINLFEGEGIVDEPFQWPRKLLNPELFNET